jgi:hypothetical protein
MNLLTLTKESKGHLEKISKLELNIVERPNEEKRNSKLIADWNNQLSLSPRLKFSFDENEINDTST